MRQARAPEDQAVLISRFVHAFFQARQEAQHTQKPAQIKGFAGYRVHHDREDLE
jgi:hypothetical protein